MNWTGLCPNTTHLANVEDTLYNVQYTLSSVHVWPDETSDQVTEPLCYCVRLAQPMDPGFLGPAVLDWDFVGSSLWALDFLLNIMYNISDFLNFAARNKMHEGAARVYLFLLENVNCQKCYLLHG